MLFQTKNIFFQLTLTVSKFVGGMPGGLTVSQEEAAGRVDASQKMLSVWNVVTAPFRSEMRNRFGFEGLKKMKKMFLFRNLYVGKNVLFLGRIHT